MAEYSIADDFIDKNSVYLMTSLETRKLLPDFQARRVISEDEKCSLEQVSEELTMTVQLLQTLKSKASEERLQFVLVVKERQDCLKSGQPTENLIAALEKLTFYGASQPVEQSVPVAKKTHARAGSSKALERSIMRAADCITSSFQCKQLAFELDIDRKNVEKLITQHSNPSEVALAIMDDWKSRHSTEATGKWLHEALINIGKKDMADQLKDDLLTVQGPEQTPRHEPPVELPAPKTIWDKIVRQRYPELKRRLATTGDIAVGCMSKELITMEDYEHLKNERDQYKHNEYLLDKLCKLPSSCFPEFASVLAGILDGKRYADILGDFASDYKRVTGKELFY